MFYKMDEDDEKIYKRVKEITLTDYEKKGDFIDIENIWSMIEDLICEIDHKEEELNDLKQNIEDNYEPIKKEEQYEVND